MPPQSYDVAVNFKPSTTGVQFERAEAPSHALSLQKTETEASFRARKKPCRRLRSVQYVQLSVRQQLVIY